MLEALMTNDFSFDTIQEINDNLQYLDYINHHYKYEEITIDPNIAYKYQGNFYGLLNELMINPKLYLFTLYLNKLTSPVEFNGNMLIIKKPIRPPIPNS